MGGSTSSVCSLCLTALSANNFFLSSDPNLPSYPNLPSFSLRPFPPVLSQQSLLNRCPPPTNPPARHRRLGAALTSRRRRCRRPASAPPLPPLRGCDGRREAPPARGERGALIALRAVCRARPPRAPGASRLGRADGARIGVRASSAEETATTTSGLPGRKRG